MEQEKISYLYGHHSKLTWPTKSTYLLVLPSFSLMRLRGCGRTECGRSSHMLVFSVIINLPNLKVMDGMTMLVMLCTTAHLQLRCALM